MDDKTQKYQRANFMLRLPHDLAEDLKSQAKREGCSTNYLAMRILADGMKVLNGPGNLRDRLARMGVV